MQKSMMEKLGYMNSCGLALLSVWREDDTAFDALSEEDQNLIWCVGEGHTEAYYMTRIESRCSLKAQLDFDMEQAESEIEAITKRLEKLLTTVRR